MYGELAERFKAPSWKGGVGNPYRGFESHVLRHIKFLALEIGLFFIIIIIYTPN